jgi:hypothetical protein
MMNDLPATAAGIVIVGLPVSVRICTVPLARLSAGVGCIGCFNVVRDRGVGQSTVSGFNLVIVEVCKVRIDLIMS